MTKKTWVDTDGVTSTQLNRIEDQLLIICTSVTRPAGVEGQHIYETDTERTLVYNGSSWAIVSEPAQGWTPTITQGSAVAGTVNRGWYQRRNGLFEAFLYWTANAGGTATNDIIISSPLTLANAADCGGTFRITDTGLTNIVGAAFSVTTTTIALFQDGNGNEVGDTYTIASTDELRLTITGRYA